MAPAAQAETTTQFFSYTGGEQTFVVPDGVTSIHVLAVGGHGGEVEQSPPIRGGSGAVVEADADVAPGQTLYVNVGGNGVAAQPTTAVGLVPGGFNGGGAGSNSGGSGGGGASDVRTTSRMASESLESRVLVAGGGGGASSVGAGGSSSEIGQDGGSGAIVDGQGGHGATAAAGGAEGLGTGMVATAGALGTGGDGGYTPSGLYASGGGGGGGGGYHGGGGGGGGDPRAGGGGGGDPRAGGGGGGSSFVNPKVGQAFSFATDTSGTPRIVISYVVPVPPRATTTPASGVGQTGATLNGVVDPEGLPTTYDFEYWTDGTHPVSTDAGDAGSGTALRAVSSTITGLAPSTEYHYRLVATNGTGQSADGGEVTFTTAAAPTQAPPTVTTGSASGVGQTGATLNGVVNPNGAPTSYQFEYGTNPFGLGSVTDRPDLPSPTGQQFVSLPLSGLAPGTEYFYRLDAFADNGMITVGEVRSFTTAAAPVQSPPLVTTSAASSVSQTGGTLNGVVNPQGAGTTYHYDYGTGTGYGSSTPETGLSATTGQQFVTAPVSGLAPGTTYHYRLVATNTGGTTTGDDRTFTTAAAPKPPAPQASTSPATGVGTTEATLHGAVNPRGSTTVYFFQYGTTTSYGQSTSKASAGSGTTSKTVQSALSGLKRHTTYHFRVVAVSANGVTYGADRTFRTS
nr:fibronectin type III domain-containing protein [Petropleomorpha daqingensis]